MKELLYDGFGLNEWLLTVLYGLHAPFIGDAWQILSYAYSYWAVAAVVLVVCYRYMQVRHAATEMQLDRMGEFLASLIIAFSVVWCVVYTFQNISLMPRPWQVLPGVFSVQSPLLWHEGLPASAPAISVMLASVCWTYVTGTGRKLLLAYAGVGCVLSLVAGINWPVEVVAGALVGWAGAVAGRWYFRLGRRLVQS